MRYLKTVILYSALLATSLLSGCNDDEPTPLDVLTIEVDADYELPGDHWAYITDSNGEVLDIKQFFAGSTVTLSTTKPLDEVTVTFFQYAAPFDYKEYDLDTYVVPVGTKVHYTYPDGSDYNPARSSGTLNLSNYNGGSVLFSCDGGTGYSSTSPGELQLMFSFRGTGPADMFMSDYRDKVPVYHIAKVNPDAVVKLDFQTDFKPFPHLLKLDAEGRNEADVAGRYNNDFRVYSLLTTSQTWHKPQFSDNPTIGYIDGFDSYEVTVVNYKAAGEVAYFKRGTFPTSVPIPVYSFGVTNRDINDFSFTFSLDYTHSISRWRYDNDDEIYMWSVHLPKGESITRLVVPQELTTKYPTLDFGKFAHWRSEFIQDVNGGGSYLGQLPGHRDYTSNFEYYMYTPAY